MENYSFMGAAAVMKMAVEMAAVMEKPSGHFPVRRVRRTRLLSPRSWLRDGGGSGRREMNHIATGTAPSLDGELLPPWEQQVMKMAVEMAAVSMEKPSGHFPSGGIGSRLLSPDLGFAMAAALEGFASWLIRIGV
ncbi:hypothetical protein QYE76_052115 [Lolium multiflorum]|uniref:Uncharacterized protein n=1 Tax=Lolium multiflorum TaxID=4521 RepID=A0AAD8WJ80_LOLMU|nr:hypothetical protein QYE76_052115 [Lolium multiflorum]